MSASDAFTATKYDPDVGSAMGSVALASLSRTCPP
jgi:hypothetical protein